MKVSCLRTNKIVFVALLITACFTSDIFCADITDIKEDDFGFSRKQPVAVGEMAYKTGLFPRCMDCDFEKETIIYDYIYKGVDNGAVILEIRPVSDKAIEDFANVSGERKTYKFPLNDMGCGLGMLEFNKVFVCLADEEYDIYIKALFPAGQNMGFADYKDEFKQYLSDNHIVVPEGKKIGAFSYELESFDKNKIEIKEGWFFYGLTHGESPHRMITIPLDDNGNAVFTMADGKKYYLTLVEDQNIWYPAFLVVDQNDEFARFWKQRKLTKIPFPAGKESPVAEPRSSSAFMDTDAWNPVIRKSKDFDGRIYVGNGEYFYSINKKQAGNFGEILVDFRGRPVYTYAKDTPETSNCSRECLGRQWKPFLSGGEPTLEPGIPGKLTLMERDSDLDPFAHYKQFQVLYNGMPLYQCDKDTPEKDPQGEGMDDLWHVARVEPSQ